MRSAMVGTLNELSTSLTPPRSARSQDLRSHTGLRGKYLILLCQLGRNPLWHSHKFTQHPLLGRFDPEPVADPAMYLRKREPTSIRPRGKRAPPSARAGSLLALLPLLPDQEAVRQHYTDGMPMEPRPQPPLILVPAQQLLGLLVISLHPVPPVRVLHHPLQRYLRTEVAPVVPPLAVRGILTDQPPRTMPPRRRHPPRPQRHEPPTHPALAPFPPRPPPPPPPPLPLHPA